LVKFINIDRPINMADSEKADLNLLRVFHTIFEARNLTTAGHRLDLSQPAVSYALGRLRAIFNDPLFVRSGNEMTPTSAALAMRDPVRRAMAAVNDALRFAAPFAATSSSRVFRVAMSDIGAFVFLPLLCDRIAATSAQLRLDVVSMPLDEVQDALRRGEIDLAIGNLPSLKRSTQFIQLFREDYVCMTRLGATQARQAMSLELFTKLSHILVTSSENAHEQIEQHFVEHGLQRNIALRVPHFTVVPEILRRTDWVVTLPRRAAPSLNPVGEFKVFELPVPAPKVSVTVHWHEDFEFNDANCWLRQMVVETLKDVA
jgi:DNA-binding transcriptional LysR family regulator